MILYELRCGAGHGFEAWFRNSDAYDLQRAGDQISCPLCGGGGVSKAPMAPRIARAGGKGREAAREIAAAESVPAPKGAAPKGIGPTETAPAESAPAKLSQQDHDRMRMVMSRIAELNQHIADTCDYVGKTFAEEARKIHYGETPVREIYGEASAAEAAELREEGIAVASLPWLKRADS